MAAAVVGDDAVAVLGQEHHLGVPVVGVEGPAVAEEDGRAVLVAPVLVEEQGAVAERDERHLGGGSVVDALSCVALCDALTIAGWNCSNDGLLVVSQVSIDLTRAAWRAFISLEEYAR